MLQFRKESVQVRLVLERIAGAVHVDERTMRWILPTAAGAQLGGRGFTAGGLSVGSTRRADEPMAWPSLLLPDAAFRSTLAGHAHQSVLRGDETGIPQEWSEADEADEGENTKLHARLFIVKLLRNLFTCFIRGCPTGGAL